jgi:hypothetical protein
MDLGVWYNDQARGHNLKQRNVVSSTTLGRGWSVLYKAGLWLGRHTTQALHVHSNSRSRAMAMLPSSHKGACCSVRVDALESTGD